MVTCKILPAQLAYAVTYQGVNMEKMTRGGRKKGLLLAILILVVSSFCGPALNAAQVKPKATENTHLTALSFDLLNYKQGENASSIQIGVQTDGLWASGQLLAFDYEKNAWTNAENKIKANTGYRLRVDLFAKNGFDFVGLTQENIKLGSLSAAEYDAARGQAFFTLPVLTQPVDPVNYTLRFDTAEGSLIESVTRPANSTIDLTEYVPTKSGFIFKGWYKDAGLTEAVSAIQLTTDTTVYAKWEKRQDLSQTSSTQSSQTTSSKQNQATSTRSSQTTPSKTAVTTVTPKASRSAQTATMGSAKQTSMTTMNNHKEATKKTTGRQQKSELPRTGERSSALLSGLLLLTAMGALLIVKGKNHAHR